MHQSSQRRLTLILIVSAITWTCSCSLITGDYDTGLGGSSGDSDTDADTDADSDVDADGDGDAPQIVVTVEGDEKANGDDVNFGDVLADGPGAEESAHFIFTIRNEGSAELHLNEHPTLAGPQASAFIIETTDLELDIAPQNETSFAAYFDPGDPGANEAVLSIGSDDPNDEIFNLDFIGEGLEVGAPEVPNGTLTIDNVSMTSQEVFWDTATDDEDPDANLEYMLFRSTTDNIETVSAAQVNGTPVLSSWVEDLSGAVSTSLNPNTLYYYNVLVRDSDGHMSAYDMSGMRSGSEIYIFSTTNEEPADALGGNIFTGNALCQTSQATSFPTLPSANVLIFVGTPGHSLVNFTVPADRPILGPSGVTIADNWGDLFDSDGLYYSLSGAGVFSDSSTTYWTGSLSNGVASNCCGSWASSAPSDYGITGTANYTSGLWLNDNSSSCFSSHYFLCISWN